MTETPKVDATSELQSRIESFNAELIPLLGKYELGLGSSAFITPEGTISSRPIVVDMRGKTAAAPEQPESTGEEASVTAA